MRKILPVLAVLGLAGAAFVATASSQKRSDLETVPKVDLDRYAGRWYEIAKFPHRFQKQCVSDDTANYTIKPNGRVEVVNSCRKKDGTIDSVTGEARVVDKTTGAKLKVRFAPSWISFLSFVWADYWVIELGPNYEYAVVSEPGRDYLWILSRTPEMDDALYSAILERTAAKGLDTNRLVRTKHTK